VGSKQTVMVLPLSDAVECGAVLQGLASSAECPLAPTMMCVQHKLRASFLTPDRRDVRACLDACKAADAVLLLSPQQCSLDATAHSMLTLLRLQGMPAPCVALLGLGATAPMNVKAAAKKTAMSALEMYNPDTKVVAVEGATECMEVWRFLSTSKPHAPAWRAVRPWVLAERLRYVPDAATAVESGELHVTGFVRGGALCADQLVHIGGCDYQIARIEGPAEPVPFRLREKANGMQTEASAASPTLARPTEAQEALIVENEVDNLAGEQTWPTEEEMADAEREAAANRKAKTTRVPKGTSQYQVDLSPRRPEYGPDRWAERDAGSHRVLCMGSSKVCNALQQQASVRLFPRGHHSH
jgi:pre-rRNA-processing protein TSR1